MYFFFTSILLTYLICEVLNQKKTMKVFRNTRYYLFKFLLANSQNVTFEQYLLKQFFPRYLLVLFGCFGIAGAGHYFMAEYDPLICISIIITVIILRIYNRNIFSSLWIELSKTK